MDQQNSGNNAVTRNHDSEMSVAKSLDRKSGDETWCEQELVERFTSNQILFSSNIELDDLMICVKKFELSGTKTIKFREFCFKL